MYIYGDCCKCLIIENKNTGSPELVRIFHENSFKVDNIQFPAHRKKTVKMNKNESIIVKKLNPVFQEKIRHGLL